MFKCSFDKGYCDVIREPTSSGTRWRRLRDGGDGCKYLWRFGDGVGIFWRLRDGGYSGKYVWNRVAMMDVSISRDSEMVVLDVSISEDL